MQFENAEQVEEVFGITLSSDQYLLVQNYITFGVRPIPDGCMGCDAAYIRVLTGQMDAYEAPEEEKPTPKTVAAKKK